MCTVQLESEIFGTCQPGRHKHTSFILYSTNLPSCPVRSPWQRKFRAIQCIFSTVKKHLNCYLFALVFPPLICIHQPTSQIFLSSPSPLPPAQLQKIFILYILLRGRNERLQYKIFARSVLYECINTLSDYFPLSLNVSISGCRRCSPSAGNQGCRVRFFFQLFTTTRQFFDSSERFFFFL